MNNCFIVLKLTCRFADYHEDLKVELYSDSLLQDWLALEEQTRRLPEHETVLRLCILDLVSGINFPKAELMEKYLDRKMGACSGFTMASISIVANDLVSYMYSTYLMLTTECFARAPSWLSSSPPITFILFFFRMMETYRVWKSGSLCLMPWKY